MVKAFFLFLLFASSSLKALQLEKILQADNAASLKSFVQRDAKKRFLQILCEKQKEKKKPPTACYELGFKEDKWCLRLSWRDLQLRGLQLALKSRFLSFPCREHLEQKQRLFLYRQKDFLLPELKNYWTEQKLFFYKEGDAHSFRFTGQ